MRSAWIDRPPCERCGTEMLLARRAPHPARPERAEVRAFECPKCHYYAPQPEEGENNPSTDRWFTCPSCGYRWSVSPLADS